MLNNEQVLKTKPVNARSLYESYGSMLLGYITAIVKDTELAEEYLVKIFSKVTVQFDRIAWDENSAWQVLRHFAQHELKAFTNMVEACEYDSSRAGLTYDADNKYLSRMSDEQRQVFCSIYYQKYTVAKLSVELNKPETVINKILKEAFNIIKQSHEC